MKTIVPAIFSRPSPLFALSLIALLSLSGCKGADKPVTPLAGRNGDQVRPTIGTAFAQGSVEPEEILAQLRSKFPSKTDEEIIRVLRDYIPFHKSAEGIGMVWLAERLQQTKKQMEVVDEIRKCGGHVSYDFDVYAGRPTLAPAWMRNLLGDDFFHEAVSVVLMGETVTDEGLEQVENLLQFKGLRLDQAQITDEGLAHIKDWTQLEWLYLQNTQITDAGVKQLKGLTHLTELGLNNIQVTDASLDELKGLKHLRHLYLDDTQISDAGIEKIKSLEQLELLFVSHTKVTKAGVQRIHEALPGCTIFH